MITEKNRMIRYMVAEQLADSTIERYGFVYEKLKHEKKELLNRGNFFWVDYLASIGDPVYRNVIRSVVLKLCRDTFGENLKLPSVNVPVRIQPVYNIEEVSKIFSRIKNPKHYAIAMLLFTESMRVNEVLSIRLKDCCKADGSVMLRNTKNGSDYKKFLDKITIEAIHKYLVWAKINNELPKELLFEGWGNKKYSPTSVRMFMKKAMRLACMEVKGSCHIFRRSASVWKCENDWSVTHLAASLNNSPRAAQKYYALVRPEFLSTLAKPIPINKNYTNTTALI